MFIQIDNDIININHIIMIEYYKKLESATKDYYSYVMRIHLRDGHTKVIETNSSTKFKEIKHTINCVLYYNDYDSTKNSQLLSGSTDNIPRVISGMVADLL